MTGGRWYVAGQGDSIEGLAHGAGVTPERIWEHSENAELRTPGRSTRIIKAGDRVFIPAPRLRVEHRPTEARHYFVLRRANSRLHVRFMIADSPRANASYTLTVDEAGPIAGVTDADGFIDHPVSPAARIAVLQFSRDDEDVSYQLRLAHLDPVTTISGVHQRLRNLGFYFGNEVADLSEDTVRAVAAFQRSRNLEPTGELTDATRDQLVSAHGS